MTPDTAKKVASSLLDATGRALMSGDFDAFAGCFRLPQSIGTIDGVRLLNTKADLERAFDRVRAHYADIGLAKLDRWIELALFDGPTVIRSCHMTHIRSADGQLLKDPVVTLSQLVCENDQWRIAGMLYSVPSDSDHGRALLSGGAQPSTDQAQKYAAEAVFQSYLDRVTRAYLDGQFATLSEAVQLPLFVQTSTGTMVVMRTDHLEEDFNRTVTQLRVHGVSDIVRRVHIAEMVGDRRIHGAYRTHILSGARLVIPAYKSAMTIEQGADLTWRMTSVIHPMGHLTMQAQIDAQDAPGHGGLT
ncbi:hypothetical protein [Antarctobacter sp.]|uniref:hypothetical protein n=1 Tax=Antarctobacter sp. TaxID=1872577 RepID=UPI003A93E3D2